MKGHPARRHRRGPSPALPLMIIAFVTLVITVAPGRPLFGLLKLALLVLIITSVVRAVHRRRHR
jgi:type III secretory pathway component EscV